MRGWVGGDRGGGKYRDRWGDYRSYHAVGGPKYHAVFSLPFSSRGYLLLERMSSRVDRFPLLLKKRGDVGLIERLFRTATEEEKKESCRLEDDPAYL